MVYIFHVEKGLTHILPMSIVVENVVTLKTTLAALTGIDTKRQVLLISGGEVLLNERKVGSYHAGTDTNPIFLFNAGVADVGGGTSGSRANIPTMTGAMDAGGLGEDATSRGSDTLQSIEAVLNMPFNSSGIAARIQLAQGFKEMAFKDENLCRRLVQQQHMQHQGWAAVIANLEDCTSAFTTARTIFEKSYRRFVTEKDQRWLFIQSFIDSDMSLLRRIPIFECFAPWRNYTVDMSSVAAGISAVAGENLLPHFRPGHFTAGEMPPSANELTADPSSAHPEESSFYSMLEWINQASHCTVESLVNNCVTALHAIDDSDVLEDLLEDSAEIADRANATEMKQVKGLSDRLFGLEQLQIELSKLAKTQTDTAQAFVQSCSTMPSSSPFAGGMESRDMSFMPSASSSPTLQRGSGGGRVGSPSGAVFIPSVEDARQAEMLRRMQHVHKKISDMRARCASAKDELCINLGARLRWVVFVERHMAELNAKLAMHIENFKRIKRAFVLLEQIHNAPRLYAVACYEIVRRKRFSSQYEQWARTVSERAHSIWQRECTHRRRIAEQLEEHFLRSAVDGLFYDAPQFAQNVPTDLTRHLPVTLGERELAELRQRVPELYELVEKEFGSDAVLSDLLDSSRLFTDVFAAAADRPENAPVSPTNDAGSNSDAKTTTMATFVLGGSGNESRNSDNNNNSSTVDASSVAAEQQQANTPTSFANAAEDDDNDTDGQSVEQFELWHDGDGESGPSSGAAEKHQSDEPPSSDAEVEHYVAVTLPLSSSANKSNTVEKSSLPRRFFTDATSPALVRSSSIDAALAFPPKNTTADTERLVRSDMQRTTAPFSTVNIADILIDAEGVAGLDAAVKLPSSLKEPNHANDFSDGNQSEKLTLLKPLMVDVAVETTGEAGVDEESQTVPMPASPSAVPSPDVTDFSTQTTLTSAHLDNFASRHRTHIAASEANPASVTRDSLQVMFSHFIEQIRCANTDLQELHQQYVAEENDKVKILHQNELQASAEKLTSVRAELHDANQHLISAREQLRLTAASPTILPPQQVPAMPTSDVVPYLMETSIASFASSSRTASLPRSGAGVSAQLPSFGSSTEAQQSSSSPPLPPRVSVLTCQPDDLVFVMFSSDIARFVVFQLNRTVPFIVDPKSYAELGLAEPVDMQGTRSGLLSPFPPADPPASSSLAELRDVAGGLAEYQRSSDVSDARMLALIRAPPVVAQVIRREYCVATKAPNRYRMPLDSKFYRVRLKRFDASAFPAGSQQQQRPSTSSRHPSVLSSSVSTSSSAQQQLQGSINTQSIYYASSPGSGGADPSWLRSL